MAEHADHLVQLRRADSEAKAARLLTTLQATIAVGETPVISVLARRAKVSRRFIYDHPELRAEIARRASEATDRQTAAISASARTTTASLRADLENAKAANRRLDADLAALRRRLGELTGKQVLSQIGQSPDPATNTRIADLEHALFETQETLARRTQELESARQINRELMGRLNRTR